MRILIAINATKPKTFGDSSLRWCGRLGYEVRIFAPKNKRKKYLYAVDDVNYHYYLALDPNETVVTRTTAKEYAYQHGFNLLVTVPEDLLAWRKKGQFKPDEVKRPYEAIATARGLFSRKPKKRIHRWANGVIMERV